MAGGVSRPILALTRRASVLALAVVCAALPASASAEIVFLTSGRTLSVKGHRMDGERVILSLRSGGEIVCARSIVARIEPDEVPYPEPLHASGPTPAPALSASLPAVPYADIIDRAAREHGVSPLLARAIIQVESAFDPGARSRKGAMGLMQLMPATARQYRVRNPYDPRANIEAGIKHLGNLLSRFELSLALAAYNAGEAAVKKFGGVPPYPETRNYIKQVLALSGLGSSR
jgi:hypothetical protein